MKIRKQTYSLCQYLKQLKNETIRTDQDCQRLSGQWNANMVGELIATVLTDNYIPPIILGEEVVSGITKSWIIDGLQRSSSLSLFRYGNIRITKTVEENLITYQRKVLDESGNPKRDGHGEITKEVKALFDVKHAHILIAAFKIFVESGHEGKEFGNFLDWFVNGGNETMIEGKTWDDLNNTSRSTRDVYIVHGKLHYLVALMERYAKEIQKAA